MKVNSNHHENIVNKLLSYYSLILKPLFEQVYIFGFFQVKAIKKNNGYQKLKAIYEKIINCAFFGSIHTSRIEA